MAVTVRDVAAKAGVSPVVVSRVLHNRALSIRVTEATAARVRQAAKELGYRKNIAAINFRSRQTFTIGILHAPGLLESSINEGPGFSEVMLRGIVQGSFRSLLNGMILGAFREGYSIMLCPKLLGNSPADAMCDGRFDGLILYSVDDTERNMETLHKCTVPFVLVHRRASSFQCRTPSVICNNRQGIRLAVDHLVELGHRRIAFCKEPWHLNTEMHERESAFLYEAKTNGLPVSEADMIGSWEIERIFKNDYTAVIACHDGLAAEIIGQARDRGIDVPLELSVVGFDSTSFCDEVRPRLTSIRQPLEELGQRAVELVLGVIREQLSDPPELTFPCMLDVRDSTGPARP